MQVRERAKKAPAVLEAIKIRRRDEDEATRQGSKFVTMAQVKIKLQ